MQRMFDIALEDTIAKAIEIADRAVLANPASSRQLAMYVVACVMQAFAEEQANSIYLATNDMALRRDLHELHRAARGFTKIQMKKGVMN